MSETQVKSTTVLPPEEPTYLPPKVVVNNRLADGEIPTLAPMPCPNLCAALAAAQKKCRAAAKESENTFHHFKYASAESVFDEAKKAMADTGLALLPLGPKLVTLGNGQYFALDWDAELLHISGESRAHKIVEGWPVIPDKGRPLDKAFASAITSALSYFLRNLLQMPRVDPADDIAGRDDRQAKPKVKEDPVDEDMVNGWKSWLEKMPDRQKVNDNLKDLSSLKGATKRVCWELTKAYCVRYGWTFNKDTKQFEETKEGATV